MTQFLRFPDESAWLAAAAEAGFMADDTLVAYSHGHAIDVVGEIPSLAGFHVNFVGTLPDGWDGFVVTPDNPYRVFC